MPKAFMFTFLESTGKKGISSTELSRKLSLHQKTCYAFKRKVMASMESSGFIKLAGTVDVDEFFVGGFEEGKVGRAQVRSGKLGWGLRCRRKVLFVAMRCK